MIVHRYVAFINFHAAAHNMILEPKNDLAKQVHYVGFMITDEDVDAIVQDWPKEWCSPLVESLPEDQNQEYPPANQDVNDGACSDARIG